jgi:DNA-binding beta-propeller fold protein YncE
MNPVAVAVDPLAGHAVVTNQGPLNQQGYPFVPGRAAILDAWTGAVVQTTPIGISPQALAVDGRYHQAFVLNQGVLDANGYPVGRGSMTVLDTQRGRVLATVPVGTNPVDLAIDDQTHRVFVVNREGGRLRVGYVRGTVTVVDTVRDAVVRTVRVGLMPQAVAVDQVAGRVFVPSFGCVDLSYGPCRGAVSILDASTGVVLSNVALLQPCAVAVDGRVHRALVVSNVGRDHGQLTVLDSRTGTRVGRQSLPPVGCGPSVLTTDTHTGRTFIVTGENYMLTSGSVRTVDSRTGTIVQVLKTAGTPSFIGLDTSRGHLLVSNVMQSYNAAGYPVYATDVLTIDSTTGKPVQTVHIGNDIDAVVDGAVDGAAQRAFLVVSALQGAILTSTQELRMMDTSRRASQR